jgi:hypothetical protein
MAPRQFFRNIKSGDVSVEGRKSNGVNLDSNGNVFLYSSANEEYLQSLTDQQYNGNIALDGMKNSIIAITTNNTDIPNYPVANDNNETLDDNQSDPNKITTVNTNPKDPLAGLYIPFNNLSLSSKKIIEENKNKNVLIVIREKLDFFKLDPSSKDRTTDGRTESTVWYKGNVIGFAAEDLVREKGAKVNEKTAPPAGEYNIKLQPSLKNRLASLFGVDFGKIFQFDQVKYSSIDDNPFSSGISGDAYNMPSNLKAWVKEKNLPFTDDQLNVIGDGFGKPPTKGQIYGTIERRVITPFGFDQGGSGETIPGNDPATGLAYQPSILPADLLNFYLIVKLGTDNIANKTYIDASYGTYGRAVSTGSESFIDGVTFHGGWDEGNSSGCIIYSPIRYSDGTVSKEPDYNVEFNKRLVNRVFNDAINKAIIVNEFENNNNNPKRIFLITDNNLANKYFIKDPKSSTGLSIVPQNELLVAGEVQTLNKSITGLGLLPRYELLQRSQNTPQWFINAQKTERNLPSPAPRPQ